MNRRELMLAIRDYIQSLPEEERYCNGCAELKRERITGARGQMITPFCEGTNRCDEHELIWAIYGYKADRPIECILNGEKYRRKAEQGKSAIVGQKHWNLCMGENGRKSW